MNPGGPSGGPALKPLRWTLQWYFDYRSFFKIN